MPSCREVDPLVTPYIDGEATAAERSLVEAHLARCPGCRRLAAVEKATRETLRARLCGTCAPDFLRARCLAAAGQTGPRRLLGSPRSLVSLTVAATLVLFLSGVLLYSLTRFSPTVLAAQLTIDHVKCFAIHAATTPVDARSTEAEFAREHDGWQIHLPDTAAAGLQLVGMRKCFCAEGAAAHVMYRLAGRPVSLYVMPELNRARASAGVFGHEAVIWSKRGTTYVLVGKESDAALQRLAADLNQGL